ncbi:MAG: hypothetical protein J7480_04370, partial [Microbacteriaceae bacterium]|nr:hypothetical protein [Microbacteriaceae bacterium]
ALADAVFGAQPPAPASASALPPAIHLAAAADAIADVALGAPKPAGVIVAGPETHDIADLAKQIAAKRGGRPRVMTAPVPGMEAFGKGLLLPPADVPGVGPTFAEWLRTRG